MAAPVLPLIAEAYEALALQWGMTRTQMSLAFCYRSRSVASTSIGATSVAQLEECLKAYTTNLSPEQLCEIDKLEAKFGNPLN
jgi:aryl-alcohol dehydrogenase-like predicted oxidoreductase